MTNSKRSGAIQALRALAIIAVFLFHLNSKWLPNGYLGVDIFFVISGYLMTRILTKSGISVKTIQTFFIRRIKRILPLYIMTIFSVLVVGRFILMAKDIRILSTDSLWSLGIVSNMQSNFHTYDYFEELTSYKLLTHTWSLSVELQYYLVVPLIMFVHLKLDSTWRIVFPQMLAFASISLMMVLPSSEAFGLLPCRMWQFSSGCLIFEISQFGTFRTSFLEKSSIPHNIDQDKLEVAGNISVCPSMTYISYLTTMLCCVESTGVPQIDRILATLSSGAVILCASGGSAQLLDIKPLQYIGDISYVFYLAHWPVITFLKYLDDETEISTKNVFLALVITSTISIIVHHSLEKWFISGDFQFVFVCIIIFYCGCAAVLMLPSEPMESAVIRPPICGFSTKNCTMLSQTYEWPQMEVFRNETRTHAKYGEQNGNGTFNVVLLGNSYMRNGFPWFYKAFSGRYRRIYAHGIPSCLPFMNHTKLRDKVFKPCDDALRMNLKLVERVRPKILMISIGVHNLGISKVPFLSATRDRFLSESLKYLKRYSNWTDYILIDTPLMQINPKLASRLQKNVEKGQNLPPRNETRFTYTIQSEFCEEEYCDSFDYDCNQPLYKTDGAHLTSFGFTRVYHKYKAAIDDLLLLTAEYILDKSER